MGATTADVVVAGAGHNALIAAAYLAKPGHERFCLTVPTQTTSRAVRSPGSASLGGARRS